MCCDHSMCLHCRELGESAREYLTKVLTYMQDGGKLTSIEGTVNCAMVRVTADDVVAAVSAPGPCQWPNIPAHPTDKEG